MKNLKKQLSLFICAGIVLTCGTIQSFAAPVKNRNMALHEKVNIKTAKPVGKMKAKNSARKDCLCATALEGEMVAEGGCFGTCVQSFGVSPMSVVMCGVACGTGNIPVCAACLGVGITAVTFCGLWCDLYGN